MIFSCGLTSKVKWAQYRLLREQWHDFFAIWPRVVTVDERGHQTCAWLQTIQRKSQFHHGWDGYFWWSNEYRLHSGEQGEEEQK